MLVFYASVALSQARVSEVNAALVEWDMVGRIPVEYDTNLSVRWHMEQDIAERRRVEDIEFAEDHSVEVDVAVDSEERATDDAREGVEPPPPKQRRAVRTEVIKPPPLKHEYAWQYRAEYTNADGVLDVNGLREALSETMEWHFFHFRKTHHETYLLSDTPKNRELLLDAIMKFVTWDEQSVKAVKPEMLEETIRRLAAMMPESTEASSYKEGSRVEVEFTDGWYSGIVVNVNVGDEEKKDTYDVKLDGYETPEAGETEAVEYGDLRPEGVILTVAHPRSLDCLCVDNTKPEFVLGTWAPKNAADIVLTRGGVLSTIGKGFNAVAVLAATSSSASAALTTSNFWLKMGFGIGDSAAVVALTIALWALAASLRSVNGTRVDPIVALNLAIGYWLPKDHEAKDIATGITAPDVSGTLKETARLVLPYTLGDHERLRGVVEGNAKYMQIFHDYCIDNECETGRLTDPLLKFYGGLDDIYVNAYKTCFMAFVKSPKSLKDPQHEGPFLQLVRVEWSTTKNATVLDGGMGLMHMHNGSGAVFRGVMLHKPIAYTKDSPLRWTLDHTTGSPLVKGLIGADFLPYQAANAKDGRSRSGTNSFSASQGKRLTEKQEKHITTPPGIAVDDHAKAALRQMFGDEYFKKNSMPTHLLYKLAQSGIKSPGHTGSNGQRYTMVLKQAYSKPAHLYTASAATMRERHEELKD